MRVRLTILLLLGVIAASFTFGLLTVRRIERQKFAQLAQERDKERDKEWRKNTKAWQENARAFLKRQGDSLANMAKELAAIDGAVPAILDDNQEWARRNWGEADLKKFAAQALWVCQRDGSPFFGYQIIAPGETIPLPPPPVEMQKLFGDQRRCHFYFRLTSGGSAAPRFMDVRGERIHPALDFDGTAPAEGYFFAGRLLDETAVQEMALLSEQDRIELLGEGPVPTPAPPEKGRPTMTYSQPLQDWKGLTIGHLVLSNRSSGSDTPDGRAEDVFRLVLSGSLALLAILYLVLVYAIQRPLGLLVRGLHTRDMAAIAPLERRQSEFGELSRLIHRFYDQGEELIRETRERASTQEALRHTEEMLLHSQKMDAIGRLAGGVAHDFNNLLTAIIGYADLLTRRLKDDPAGRQDAQVIHQAGEQAAGLTRQLLAFSRKQLLQPKVIDLNHVVTSLHKMLQRIIGEHIEIRTEPAAQLWRVRADAGQIEQVIVNLGVNARDAMPRGGRLTLRTVNVTLAQDSEEAQLKVGNYVALEVSDTGEGMDAATRSRIFEPFFTTKGPGKGTGLGLSTVYGIVRQSGGGVIVQSERGAGTTFRILLPREDAALDFAEAAPFAPVSLARAERILFVEDDELVRELVSLVLREHGYELLTAQNGREAIRLAEQHGAAIDLLISDVVMPEMNGAEVAQRVHSLAPGAKVLFVSGYSEADMSDQGLGVLAFEILQKPFRPDDLARKVREVLDSARRP